MMKHTIFLVEDEENLVFGIKSYLQRKDFTVHSAGTAADARSFLERKLPSLMVIDWNLPDGNGASVCEWIRSKWKRLPVIFLTVRGNTRDMVQGFNLGADDYIVKPFELEVLYSRICAILRRAGGIEENTLLCGPIVLDKIRIQVFYNQEEILLSAIEYQLLLLLMENKNHTLPKNRLLETIWDLNGNFTNTLGHLQQRRKELARYLTVGLAPGGTRRLFLIEAFILAIKPILISLAINILLVQFALNASLIPAEEFLQKMPILPVAVFALIILFSVGIAYYIGGKKICTADLMDTLKDDTMI